MLLVKGEGEGSNRICVFRANFVRIFIIRSVFFKKIVGGFFFGFGIRNYYILF